MSLLAGLSQQGEALTAHNDDATAHGGIITHCSTYERGGIKADGTAPALVIPANANTALGLYDFSLKTPLLVLPSWAPAAAVVLFDSVASNLGVRVSLLPTAKIRVQFGNGSDLTTFLYDTSEAIDFDNYAAVEVVLTAQRDSSLSVYANGQKVGSSFDIHAAQQQTLTSTADWKILSDGTTHFEGWVYEQFAKGNIAYSAQEVAARWEQPDLWKSEHTGEGYFVTNDSVLTGISVYRSTATGGQTIDGESDWWRVYANYEGVTAHSLYASLTIPDGAYLRCRIKLSMPTLNTTATGIEFRIEGSPSFYVYDVNSTPVGEVIEVDMNGTLSGSGTIWRMIQQYGSGTQPFQSANDPSDDVYYFKDMVIETPGTQVLIDVGTNGPQKRDMMGHGVNAYTTMQDVRLVTSFDIRGSVSWSATSSPVGLGADGATMLGAHDVIDSFFAKSASGEHFVIGDESDSARYFAEAVIPATWTELTLAANMSDGTNGQIIATPMDGADSPEVRTDSLDYMLTIKRLA